MKPLIITLFLLVSLCGQGASRTVLYETGFEAPDFDSRLPAEGQSGWRVSGGAEALSIATNHAHTGQQVLRIDGGRLQQTGPNSSEAYFYSTVVADAPPTNGAPVVELSASVRLDGPQTGTNGLPENDLMSANFLAVGLTKDHRFENLGQLLLSSAGRIFTTGTRSEDQYKYSVPLNFGTYYRLTLRVDFVDRTISYLVDGNLLGSAPFAPNIQAERIGVGALVMVGPLTPFSTPYEYDPSNYTAYFDDYLMESVPASGPSVIVEESGGERLANGTGTVDFGSAQVGTSVLRGFALRNVGDADLTGIKVSVDGPNAEDFSVTASPVTSINSGESSSFTIRFHPALPGLKSAKLQILSNDPNDNPFTLSLIGRGPNVADIAQQAYVKASNASTFDFFGTSIAISGDTMVVGAPNEDSNAAGVNGNESNNSAADSGAVYIFVRNATTWVQQAYLKASNTEPINPSNSGVFRWDFFGSSVAISGDTVVVGAPTEGSNATGVDGDQSDNSGYGAGAAYVFVREGTNWTQQAYLKASNTKGAPLGQYFGGDAFGTSVSVSGDTIVVGAPNEDSNATGVNGDQSDDSAKESGAAYVFVREGKTWKQEAYLKPSNTEAGDGFGGSVAISSDTIVVGAIGESSNSTGVNGDQGNNKSAASGAAYVFGRDGRTWTQEAYLKASNAERGDLFGGSVAISSDTIVVGAASESSNSTGVNGDQGNNKASSSGAAYVFVRDGTTWIQQAYLKASNTSVEDYFGYSVSVSGDTVVIGAPEDDSSAIGVNGNQANNSAPGAGAAYLFRREGTTWSQEAYLKASNTGGPSSDRPNGDQFGYSVAVSGETVAVGAWEEDSNATGINGNQNNNSAGESGAAYVFTRSVPQIPPRILIPTRDPGGVIHLPVEVTSGQTYTLQFSDDLNHWSDVTTEWATSDRIEFVDASSNPSRMRLYRVREN